MYLLFRYELPGIHAFNFVLEDSLGGGGIASLRSDPQVSCFYWSCSCDRVSRLDVKLYTLHCIAIPQFSVPQFLRIGVSELGKIL